MDADTEAAALWTRLRCGRGHLSEHPGPVVVADLDACCWCGGPRVAATEFRLASAADPRPTAATD
jgi:hypothetical protein